MTAKSKKEDPKRKSGQFPDKGQGPEGDFGEDGDFGKKVVKSHKPSSPVPPRKDKDD